MRFPGGFHIQRTLSQAVDMCKRMLAWNERYDVRGRARKRARS